MPPCPNCGQEAEFEENGGELNCTLCGAVVEGQNLSSEVTFAKGAGGESAAVGQYVGEGAGGGTRLSGGRVYNQVDSQERSLAKGRDEIQHLVLQLQITPHIDTVEGAHRLYTIALQRNFTRGRRTAQVAGACLYILCRQEQKPFMLIDISDVLQINVFVLGSVFLQMCHLLRLEEHPMFSRPIDPSLYIHRFVHKLMSDNKEFTRQKQNAVTNTALRLVKSMKRDWMQTGRRPSGICGAALFIATHIHGLEFTSREIVARIHIGEATLAKRVNEFATTAAGDLTYDEFDARGREIESAQLAMLEKSQPSEEETVSGQRCIHIDMGGVVFSSGMCLDCYREYLENAGGQLAGSNPPAYTQGLLKANKKPQADDEDGEEEEEQEETVLALPAPGDEGRGQGGDVEADMHAAIASAEMADFAKAALPQAEVRRSTRAATRAAHQANSQQPHSNTTQNQTPHSQHQQPPADSPQAPPPETPEGSPSGPPDNTATTQPSTSQLQPAQHAQHAQRDTDSVQQAAADEPIEEGAGGSLAGPSTAGEEGKGQREEQTQAQTDKDATVSPMETAEEDGQALALALQPLEEEEEPGESLSDVEMDLTEFIVHDEDEVRQKEQIWDTMNADYLQKQELKRLQLEEAHQARTDKLAEQEAKDAEGGRKRGRGRPLGSKTKPRPEDCLGPSSTPLESARNLLQAKKLTGKIDYDNLERLFEDPSESAPNKKRKVGEALQDRAKRQADAAAAKQRRQQQALAADAKRKPRTDSGSVGFGLRSGLGKGGGLSMLGRFSKPTEEPTSPSRFRPLSPTAAGGSRH